MVAYYRDHAETIRQAVRRRDRRTPEDRQAEYARKKERGWKLDPIKRAARNAVTHALEKGELQRGECERAAEGACRGKIHAHHDDYEKPLDVRWLCHRHHAEHHRVVA